MGFFIAILDLPEILEKQNVSKPKNVKNVPFPQLHEKKSTLITFYTPLGTFDNEVYSDTILDKLHKWNTFTAFFWYLKWYFTYMADCLWRYIVRSQAV